ncbi:MAG: 2Fe-2S iron-sulfur cluster-binding protein [Halieaceae bacterium]|nr:2Fe-2S iron-sulfur cluster-binding protein [Halieaceae bacterium]
MIKISFLTTDDEEHHIEAAPGINLMQVATGEGVPGIAAECGGAMACATCHVHVDEAWYERLPEPAQDELAMLQFADNPGATSRLSCQIEVTPELDGLVVRVPEVE